MSRVARLGSALAGALLLAWIAPHRNPWEMTRFVVPEPTVWWVVYGTLGIGLAGWIVLARRRRLGPVSISIALLLAISLAPVRPRAAGVVLNVLLGGLGTALLVFGLAHTRVSAGAKDLCRRTHRRLTSLPRGLFALSLFLGVFVVCLLGSHFALGRIPHVVDAVDQLFHAKILLSGATWAPEPHPGEFFDIMHMIREGGQWYSQYPPGHTLLLALGLFLRAPWLVNPIFAALSVVLLYGIGREMYDEKTARWAALCGAVSPFVWIMGSSFMNHTTTMFFFCLFLFGYTRMVRHGRTVDAGLAGLALGCGFCIRPWTTAAVAAPFALHALARLIRPGRSRLVLSGVVLLLVLAIPLAGLLAFNQSTNGDAWTFGYEVAHGSDTTPGFGKTGFEGRTRVHSPYWGLTHTLNNLNVMNQYLFGWPFASLLLPLLALIGFRSDSWDAWLYASIGLLLLAYFLYWYHDWAYGPRFLYSAVAPLALLSGRALTLLPGSLERCCGRRALQPACLALVVTFGYAWTVNVPVLAAFYSRSYFDSNADVVAAVSRQEIAGSVVLVPRMYYASVFARNSPSLDGPVVYAMDIGEPANRVLRERFPERDFYRLRSFERYELQPYEPGENPGPPVYEILPDRPLTVEALTFQVSRVAGGRGGNRKTGELGGGWKNHDELKVGGPTAGAEVGFLLSTPRDARRKLSVAMGVSRDSGIVEVLLNGASLRRIDLYAKSPGVRTVSIGDVDLQAGRNGLAFRVVGKHESSDGWNMGLDYFRLD